MKIGERINNLVILDKKGQGFHKDAIYKCKCDCGNIVYFNTSKLKRSKDCGCSKKNRMVGKKFGMLTILEETNKRTKNGGNIIYKCKCDCGNITYVASNNLTKGNHKTVSCGCYNKLIKTKHNLSGTRIYDCYVNIKQRCYNKKCKSYKDYGARGIKMCQEWKDKEKGFINFYKWAIENGYKENLTIDRINNNGNYEPSNCRWVLMKEQMNNTRRSHYIIYNGEIKTIAEWSRILNINYSTLYNNIIHCKNYDSFSKYIVERD